MKIAMASTVPNPRNIRSFRTDAAFATWMAANHARQDELWLKIHKKGLWTEEVLRARGLASIAARRSAGSVPEPSGPARAKRARR